ncbi:MAG: DUF6152 family protein [Propionivibrio sp.]
MERRQFIMGIPLVLASRPLWAHHGWSSFDETRPVYLAGTVSRVRWQNPHAELTLDLASPLVLPENLKTRTAPRQLTPVDAGGVFAKAVLPTRRDAQWEIELSPLTRLQAWNTSEIKVGERLEVVGYTFGGEKGAPLLRVEFLIRGDTVTPLRSSPA